MKTVVEELLDELKESCQTDDIVYMHFESRRQYWLEKEKKQLINAVELKLRLLFKNCLRTDCKLFKN